MRPKLERKPEPDYPRRARRRGKEATVVVAVLVDEEGKVIQSLVTETDDPGLGFEEAALEAAQRASFTAATKDGVPGRMWTELVFDFRLH